MGIGRELRVIDVVSVVRESKIKGGLPVSRSAASNGVLELRKCRCVSVCP